MTAQDKRKFVTFMDGYLYKASKTEKSLERGVTAYYNMYGGYSDGKKSYSILRELYIKQTGFGIINQLT